MIPKNSLQGFHYHIANENNKNLLNLYYMEEIHLRSHLHFEHRQIYHK
nr:MAG TPA: hypothetical protein [Caudoviricetes sp.]